MCELLDRFAIVMVGITITLLGIAMVILAYKVVLQCL